MFRYFSNICLSTFFLNIICKLAVYVLDLGFVFGVKKNKLSVNRQICITQCFDEKNRLISNCAQAMYYNGCLASEVKKNNSSKFDKKWMREDLWGFKDAAIQLPILLHHLTETRKKVLFVFRASRYNRLSFLTGKKLPKNSNSPKYMYCWITNR